MSNIEQVQQVSNSSILWVLCGFTVFVSLLQTVLYMRQCSKMTKEARIDPTIPKEAFRVGLISAIGPALGVFIVMVGLMASIGGPMAWLRLSIIGAAATELSAANIGADACGVALGSEQYTLLCLAVSWFTMALNGAGWLLFTGVGIFGYLNAGEILKGVGNTLAVLTGAVSMVILVKTVCRKIPKLMEYSLGIAMIIGMIFAVGYDQLFM